MFNNIKKIQQKPEHIRRGIAFFVTMFLFFLIISLWLFLDNWNTVSREVVGGKINTPTPFTNVKNTLSGAFYDMKKEAGSIMDYTKSIKDSFITKPNK